MPIGALRAAATANWVGRPVRVKLHGSGLHAISWPWQMPPWDIASGGNQRPMMTALVCIARNVIPRVRPPICCVLFAAPNVLDMFNVRPCQTHPTSAQPPRISLLSLYQHHSAWENLGRINLELAVGAELLTGLEIVYTVV
jgi:hypothetical protein